MVDAQTSRILQRLASQEFKEAWTEFLELYSLHILQTVKLFERDADPVADCYLYVCERLSEKRFRRLRSFRSDCGAQFTTWLRVVVRNLCMDWHRSEFGRHRVFQSIGRLGALEQEIFRCIYEQDLSLDETLNSLHAHHPNLTMAELEAGADRVRSALTDRQIWLATTRRKERLHMWGNPRGDSQDFEADPVDPTPSIESLLMLDEQKTALSLALNRLSKSDRLLIKLRFERGLTLQETALLLGLKDAQTVDRQQRDIIEKLRYELEELSGTRGKI
jgi:RNA polymerase sigma factor (sigma-70 family)